MATPPKIKQLSLAEYAKIKEKLAKSRLKLSFPLFIKIFFLVPLVYGIFLITYFLFHLRFLAEH
jgi:hypothetical protein